MAAPDQNSNIDAAESDLVLAVGRATVTIEDMLALDRGERRAVVDGDAAPGSPRTPC